MPSLTIQCYRGGGRYHRGRRIESTSNAAYLLVRFARTFLIPTSAFLDYVGLDKVLGIAEVLEKIWDRDTSLRISSESWGPGFYGVKSGRGFYVWDQGDKVGVNPASNATGVNSSRPIVLLPLPRFPLDRCKQRTNIFSSAARRP